MKKVLLIMLILIPVLVVGQETVKYDYMTIVQTIHEINICGSEKFEIIDIRKEQKAHQDFRPILKRVKQFELENWEVLYVDVESYSMLSFVMRREKGYVGNEDK